MSFMRALSPLLLLALVAGSGCEARNDTHEVETKVTTEMAAVTTTVVDALPSADCTAISVAVDRLACFDAIAGTPADPPSSPAVSSAPGASTESVRQPLIVELMRSNEAERQEEDSRFLMTEARDPVQVVISAPALGSVAPRPYLAISCLSDITRLQLLVDKTIERNQVRLRLLVDGRPVSDAATWQVLEEGGIVDAGRGLVAIDLLRRLGKGSRLQVESDYPPFDGLVFDATGLEAMIERERKACHW
ncbi:type VI secretion system-associated protein VasI [Zestomonas carbonaria]|uniref:Type VI secretion system-associated protein TagO n=1 Tax=Zestomonas carbonaria TaxID=2762745 RepID=A0A7U7EQK5_9GAMM|nr:type VI secretion system-associated protein VasI [Pseudomonas carbonaria]CAD5109368.1 hypothetical protein PSEWESI4_03665 [Pseudomonas carbonaria]